MKKRIFYHEFKPAIFVSLWVGLYGFHFHKTQRGNYWELKFGLFMFKWHDWTF